MIQKGKSEIFHDLKVCYEPFLALRYRVSYARIRDRTPVSKGGLSWQPARSMRPQLHQHMELMFAKILNELGSLFFPKPLTKTQVTNALISALWNPEKRNQQANLDFWHTKWGDNKSVLFEAYTTSVVICPDSKRKLIQNAYFIIKLDTILADIDWSRKSQN